MKGSMRIAESVAVIVIVAILCTLVMLIAQGRLFSQVLVDGPLSKPFGDGSYYFCLPGVTAVLLIWGHSSTRTIFSDLVIVAVNTILYSIPILLVLWARHRWPGHKTAR
jgi:hypothetical protein